MAITQAFPTAAKLAFLRGEHQAGHTYKIALYTASANLGASTEAYTTSGEVSGDGYTAGGKELEGITFGTAGTIAYMSADDPVWEDATISARGALIYNDTLSGKPVVTVLDFGETVSSTNAAFMVDFPPAGANALIRFE